MTLAIIAVGVWVLVAMFGFELFAAGRRYRDTVETLLLERTLRERVNGRRHVRTGQQRNGQRDEDEPAGDNDLAHDLIQAARSDGEVPA